MYKVLLAVVTFFIRWFVRPLVYIPVRIFFPTRFINKKELRKHRGKGVVICCNHRSNADGFLLYLLLWRKKKFLTKPSLFKNPIRRLVMGALDCYPIERGKELGLIRYSQANLKKNRAIVVFPEGQRVFNPEDALALRNGAAMMAIKGGVPVVPMVYQRAPKLFRRNKIKVGETISVDEYLGKKMEKSDMLEFSGKIQSAMAGLLENFEIKPKLQWWETEPTTCSRAIVFVDDKLLFIKRNRGAGDYYVTPGGHLDGEESPRDAVVREVREECNIEVEPRRLLYRYQFEGNPEWKHDGKPSGQGMHSFFLCEYKSGEVGKTDAEEYAPELDPSRGTYEPVLVSEKDIKNLDIRPGVLKKQLVKDLKRYKKHLARSTKFLK